MHKWPFQLIVNHIAIVISATITSRWIFFTLKCAALVCVLLVLWAFWGHVVPPEGRDLVIAAICCNSLFVPRNCRIGEECSDICFNHCSFSLKKKSDSVTVIWAQSKKKTSAAERPCRERLLPLALYVFFYKALLTPVLCIQPNNILMISTKRSQFHNFIVSFHIFAFFKIGKVNIHRN